MTPAVARRLGVVLALHLASGAVLARDQDPATNGAGDRPEPIGVVLEGPTDDIDFLEADGLVLSKGLVVDVVDGKSTVMTFVSDERASTPWPSPVDMGTEPTSLDADRRTRAAKYNRPERGRMIELPPGLNHLPTFECFGKGPEAMPTHALVFVADVESAQSYQSLDGTMAYTEYEARVLRVLARRAAPETRLVVGETVTLTRRAGLLLWPDRRLQWNDRMEHEGIPRRNGRYLFFARPQDDGALQLLTGYLIAGGQIVEALDSPFSGYKGASLSTFVPKISERGYRSARRRSARQETDGHDTKLQSARGR